MEEVKEEAMEMMEMAREGKPAFMKIDCYRFMDTPERTKALTEIRMRKRKDEKDPIKSSSRSPNRPRSLHFGDGYLA